MSTNSIKNLISMSHAVGNNPAYVQGGGGNTSVKFNDHQMAVKASGGLLKEMSLQQGYSVVDYKAIRDYIASPQGDEGEDAFTQNIMSFVVETNNRPSIETGFHAQLGTCVIHTHSVYANLLTCSKEGKSIVATLFPDALWVNYATPGKALTLAIRKALKTFSQNPKVIFLQNHGLIVIEKNAPDTLHVHESVNQTIQKHFHLNPAIYTEKRVDIPFAKQHVLFPDQVVYTLSEASILKTKAAKETLWAYDFILNTLKNLGLAPHFIPQDKARVLLHMESEKFRQKALKK